MAKFICELEGVRGRVLKLYDNKCVIVTNKTFGSLISGNITDGEKTIFLCDVVGVQFKKSGGLIGYLQLETPSMQMNNQSDNMFSENTFTFEHGVNGITNGLMVAVYHYITDRLEELKYGTPIIQAIPDFEAMKTYEAPSVIKEPAAPAEPADQENPSEEELYDEDSYIDIHCPYCGEPLSFLKSAKTETCPWCSSKITLP